MAAAAPARAMLARTESKAKSCGLYCSMAGVRRLCTFPAGFTMLAAAALHPPRYMFRHKPARTPSRTSCMLQQSAFMLPHDWLSSRHSNAALPKQHTHEWTCTLKSILSHAHWPSLWHILFVSVTARTRHNHSRPTSNCIPKSTA